MTEKEFRRRVLARMKKPGFTYRQIAEVLGISESATWRKLKGRDDDRRGLKYDETAKLERFFAKHGCPINAVEQGGN